uniref:Golgi SNAP receptor complex member 1 n=1 Tax=Syphacia muris TaxID=451379 RepID=A0A0N5AUH7_9BILA
MLESTRQALLKYWEGGSVNSVVTLFCWVIMVDVWDDLRRRARTLENHIDTKLVALNKLASGKYDTSVSDKPTVNSKQSIFESLSSELEAMVARLTQINDQMSEHFERSQGAVNNGWVTNPALKHTLRRHREILRDYCTEFRRARDNIGNQIQRESLMSGGTSENSVLNNRLKSNDLYLKEQDHINSCDRLLDEQISIAMNTREHVNKQRLSLRDISKRMQALSSMGLHSVYLE